MWGRPSLTRSSTSLRLDATAGINLGLCAVAIPPAWLVVRKVGITPDGTYLYRPPVYTEEHMDPKTYAHGQLSGTKSQTRSPERQIS